MSIAALRIELASMPEDDLRACLPDFFKLQMGMAPPLPHPGAELLMNTSATIAELACALTDGDVQNRAGVDTRHIRAALQSSEFNRALTSAFELVATTANADLLSDVQAMTRPVRLNDYRPSNMPSATVDEFEPMPEGGEVGEVVATFQGEPIRLTRSSKNLLISRESLLQGDQMALITTLLDAVGQASGRAVARATSDLLMTNPVLIGDATPWFSTLKGNDLTPGTGISVTTLSAAVKALSDMPTYNATSPKPAGVKAKTLLVPVDLLSEARSLVSAMSLTSNGWMNVISLPELSGHWYVLGDTSNAAIALGTFTGNPLTLQAIPENAMPNNRSDDVGYRARNEFAVAPINRFVIRSAVA